MIPFTEEEKTTIGDFVHAVESDTLIITECERLVDVLANHKLIENKDELLKRVKEKEAGIVSELRSILTSKISNEQGRSIMDDYYGIKRQSPVPEDSKTEENSSSENIERWGVGNAKDSKAFDHVYVGKSEYELIHGEHPHSRQDNTTYARSKENPNDITGFSGHRMPFKIEIEEYNYHKSSHLSGDEIRKGCTGKLFLNGQQIFECGGRTFDRAYKNIERFIDDMELNWSWFPKKVDEEIGRLIKYEGQMFRIKRFIIDQACMILETADGKPRKPFASEAEDVEEGDFETETTVKVDITSPNIWWYPTEKEKAEYNNVEA